MEAGEAIPLAKWTTYEEDVAYYGRGLEKMKKTAHQDFADGRKRLPLRIQTFREAQEDPEKMKKYVAALQTLQDQGFTRWTDEHKRKIGQWFGDESFGEPASIQNGRDERIPSAGRWKGLRHVGWVHRESDPSLAQN